MDRKNYLLIVKIPITAMDDIEARDIAQSEVDSLEVLFSEVKLQEIFDNKPPRGIALNPTQEG